MTNVDIPVHISGTNGFSTDFIENMQLVHLLPITLPSPSLSSFPLLWSWKEKVLGQKAGAVRIDSSFPQLPKQKATLFRNYCKNILENNSVVDAVRYRGPCQLCISKKRTAICCSREVLHQRPPNANAFH